MSVRVSNADHADAVKTNIDCIANRSAIYVHRANDRLMLRSPRTHTNISIKKKKS